MVLSFKEGLKIRKYNKILDIWIFSIYDTCSYGNNSGVTVYKSLGMAIQDLAAGEMVFQEIMQSSKDDSDCCSFRIWSDYDTEMEEDEKSILAGTVSEANNKLSQINPLTYKYDVFLRKLWKLQFPRQEFV